MSYENIHANDTWGAELVFQQDGVTQDISTYSTLKIIFIAPDGTATSKDASFKTDGTDGTITYTVPANTVTTTAGQWFVFGRIDDGPTSEEVRFLVHPRMDA